jgi:biotin synthase
LANQKVCKWWKKNKKKIFEKTLNFISLMRETLKDVNIAAGTALDVFDPMGRIKALKVGANVIMPSVTPKNYRKKYLLYENKPCVDEDAEKCFHCIINKIKSSGFKPTLGVRGDSEHFINKALK